MDSGAPIGKDEGTAMQAHEVRPKRSRIIVTLLSLLAVTGVFILAGKLLNNADHSNQSTLPASPISTGWGLDSPPATSQVTTAEVPPPPPTEQPLTPQVYCKQGYTLLHKQRRIAEAISMFETCLRFYPDYSDAHHGLAQALRNSGDSVRALSSHDRAIAFDPDRHDLYWERGVTWLQLNNYDGAITNFEACLERKIDYANAHLGLGMGWRGKGDYVEALLHHDEALRLNPRSAWFYNERARTHEKKGDRRSAEADFAKAREIEQGK